MSAHRRLIGLQMGPTPTHSPPVSLCILDAFDGGGETIRAIDSERWEQARATITESLKSWQQYYARSTPFAAQFASLLALIPSLPQLDTAFAILLDSAAAIFGDILPGFRAISTDDDTTIAALLFDLMQQSDQLLVQFETTLEPLNALISHFSIRSATLS